MIRIKLVYIFILFCLVSGLLAQTKEDIDCLAKFAIINDQDGYTNVRDDKLQIIDKIYKDEIFEYCYFADPIGKYQPIVWGLNSEGEYGNSGFIHESRIKYLYQLPILKRKINGNSAFFETTGIRVVINIGTFDITSKRVSKDPESHFPIKIDGYRLWGSDCIEPDRPENNTEIKSIEYTINGVTRRFDNKDFGGYLFPNLSNSFVSMGDNGTLYISMNNGDGAGSYSLLWVLKNGEIINKIVFVGF